MSTNVQGRLQYDPKRGVAYFFDDKTGACLLRIEGVYAVPEGDQIDIHLFEPGLEHHHEYCGNTARVVKEGRQEPGAICAAKLPKKILDHQSVER